MRRRLKLVATLGVLGLLGALVVAPMEAGAAVKTYNVQVGAPLFRQAAPAPADGMKFYAPPLKVHKGDSIKFQLRGFHTATLIPANVGVFDWVTDNAGGVNKPWSLLSRDPDDGKGHVKFNNAAIFPSQQNCGTADDPCAYSGADVVNSGAFVASPNFVVKVNADPGDFFWAVCLVHPRMKLKVEVVPDGDATTKQSAIDAYKSSAIKSQVRRAKALHNILLGYDKTTRTGSGTVVHHAYAGYDGKGFSLLGFYPKRAEIRNGQKVHWHWGKLRYEDHTVTFPAKKARALAQRTGAPVCDPDGDGGPGPDNPPETNQPPFCNNPNQLEFDIPARFAEKRGDGRFKRFDFSNSGAEGAGVHTGQDPYTLKFTRVAAEKGFGYICMIHPFMRARVVVKPRR